MPAADGSGVRLIRFGTFEFALDTRELRNRGAKVKIEGQPLSVLALLLERPGSLVTREDLKQRLWPDDTFVDFEHSINAAVKRLREALHDSATAPRFIETLPKRGYRFIYPVNGGAADAPPAARRHRRLVLATLAVLALLVAVFASDAGGIRSRVLGPAPRLPVESVAVLPLRNYTGDGQLELLADGLTDALTTELAQVRQLAVPSVTSTMTYKADARKDSRAIARELRVAACVEGSLQRSYGRLVVNLQLVDGSSDRHIWADKYEVDVSTLQALAHRLARDLVRSMGISLTGDQQVRLATARTLSAEAYQAYLLARQPAATLAGGARRKALLEKAIAIDPAYAQAYAELALLAAHGGYAKIGSHRGDRDLTRQLARRALELDGGLAEAHAALAWVEMSDWDWWSAEEHFRRAIDLNPNLRVARVWYAEYLQAMGRSAEAVRQADQAIRLDPRRPESVSHATQVYAYSGRVDDAIRVYREVLQASPDYWFAHQGLGEALLLKGMHPEAVVELETAIRLCGDEGNTRANIEGQLARAYVGAGHPEKARQIAARFEAQATARPTGVSAYGPVMAYLALGDHGRALHWLEQSYEKHGVMMMMLNRAVFDPLRADPRFQDLVRRIGLPRGGAGNTGDGRLADK